MLLILLPITIKANNRVHAPITISEAATAARMLVKEESGRWRAQMEGHSMFPLADSGAVVVVNPIAYDKLKSGMVVAYHSDTGCKVVHQLSHREGRYWRAKGINNRTSDRELVTPAKLIGELYAVFYTQ